jgi:hypothetical protein
MERAKKTGLFQESELWSNGVLFIIIVNEYFGGKRNSLPRSFGDASGTLWTDSI